MISFECALARIRQAAVTLGTEPVTLRAACDRVLAQDVLADTNVPPFDKSAMDGYACRRADLHKPLRVITTIHAGTVPTVRRIGPGQCVKIMTGALVPPGADCVIMREFVRVLADHTIQFTGRATAPNICRAGEDIRKGALVLRAGTLLKAPHIATLAMLGCTRPRVYRRARVGILATGSELVPPGHTIHGAAIRDSNSHQLMAQVAAVGAVPRHYGIVKDIENKMVARIRTALRACDLLLITGGVSVGDLDLVPDILKALGFTLVCETVAMKPGKPMLFGTHANGNFCCGLPGNPVSTFVAFELLLKPFLYRLMGHDYRPPVIKATLGARLQRKNTGRREAIPVTFTEAGTVVPVEYHSSAHISALCLADGLVFFPVGVSALKKGALVAVHLLGALHPPA